MSWHHHCRSRSCWRWCRRCLTLIDICGHFVKQERWKLWQSDEGMNWFVNLVKNDTLCTMIYTVYGVTCSECDSWWARLFLALYSGVRAIPVSGIGRYLLVFELFDTSSPVIRLPVSTVNTVAVHAYSFKPIPYFCAYTPHTHTYTTHKITFSVKKNLYSPVSVSV